MRNPEFRPKYMRRWYEFLRSFETDGGIIFTFVFLLILFIVLNKFLNFDIKGELTAQILAGLLTFLRLGNRNKNNDNKGDS